MCEVGGRDHTPQSPPPSILLFWRANERVSGVHATRIHGTIRAQQPEFRLAAPPTSTWPCNHNWSFNSGYNHHKAASPVTIYESTAYRKCTKRRLTASTLLKRASHISGPREASRYQQQGGLACGVWTEAGLPPQEVPQTSGRKMPTLTRFRLKLASTSFPNRWAKDPNNQLPAQAANKKVGNALDPPKAPSAKHGRSGSLWHDACELALIIPQL